MKKSSLIALIVGIVVVGIAVTLLLMLGRPVATVVTPGAATSATAPTSLQQALNLVNAAPRARTSVAAEDATGKVVNHDLVAPDATAAQNLVPFLAIDQMYVCDPLGACKVATVPLNAGEQAVVAGTSEVSARAVYNADAPTGPVQMFDKIYGRAIFGPTATGERWYREIDLGMSWSGPIEVTITRGTHHCNSFVSTTSAPAHIVATLDNSTCDGDGQPIVVRWAALLFENDVQSCALPQPQGCVASAPITVLPYKRKGYQVIYGDDLKNAYQAQVLLGQPLP